MNTPAPNLNHAAQDFGGMALWTTLNAEGKAPDATTLVGAGAGVLLWQYFGKQRAHKYVQQITSGEVAKALESAVGLEEKEVDILGHKIEVPIVDPGAAQGAEAFAGIEADVEDNVALYVLGRPLTYLATLYAAGMVGGKRLSLPEYLTIAAAGAGTGSFVRSNFFNKYALNPLSDA